jgi:PPOX class probable F420-dependent enzyme
VNLTAAQARTRFAAARVARLATVGADGAPHLVPVTFALGDVPGDAPGHASAGAPGDRIGHASGGPGGEPLGDVPGSLPGDPATRAAPYPDTLYFAVDHKPKRSTDLRRLRNIAAEPRVSLLADHYADDWARLWWARADGVARVVPDGAVRDAGLALLRRKHPQYAEAPPRGPVVAIEVRAWTGWAFTG